MKTYPMDLRERVVAACDARDGTREPIAARSLGPHLLDPRPARAAARDGQAPYSGAYLRGLLPDGEPKSIEPPSRRVTPPGGLTVKDLDRALQQLIGRSTRDEQAVRRRYRSVMAETFADPRGVSVIDDTSSPERGGRPVGVRRRYRSASGERANRRVAPSVHSASPEGHHPPAMRLDLPESRAGDADRLDRAGVPREHRGVVTKGRIAPELLDRVRSGGLSGRLVVADAGCGASGPSRDGLPERGLRYIAGVTGERVVFAGEPDRRPPPPRKPGRAGGRPRGRSWPRGRPGRSPRRSWRRRRRSAR